MDVKRLVFEATERKGDVTGLWVTPETPSHALVLAHAASTGIEHPSMVSIAEALDAVGIATFRYNFPYMEKGGGGLDGQATCTETVRSAIAYARGLAGSTPILAGGRSFGGRMTSTAAAESPIEGLVGVVFYAFPLHSAGKPSVDRAEHLKSVDCPMLFLSGTRDALAEIDLLQPVVKGLPNARLHTIDTADHSFKVLKRSGMTEAIAQEQAAEVVSAWARSL